MVGRCSYLAMLKSCLRKIFAQADCNHPMSTTATDATCGPFLGGILILNPVWTLILGGTVCKSLRNMVGASGFEPPTSWSRTSIYQQLTSIVH